MSAKVLTGEFRAVAVLNRGEAAMRFIRGAETWSRKNATPLDTIALYTDVDAETPFVRAATRAVRLDEGATKMKTPYLDIELMLDAAEAAGADAIWPGWGFVAEEPALARACHRRGLIFLGPPASAIDQMSDKVTAKTLADKNGVPVAPWSKRPVGDAEEAIELLSTIGYPALLKSAAGGGGRGIRLVQDPSQVASAFTAAAAEALATSGNPELFIERFVDDARHVEVQILADAHGTVWTLGTRDCSVQRRNQKLLEEAPAPELDDQVDWALQHAAHTLATACGYVGVGTAEFLLLPDDESFYFLEMNTRLQVEHTVTEAIYGIDLVAYQIDVARGVSLEDETFPEARGVALEARLNAEDPDDHFAPRTGTLVRFSPPDGPWVRVDTGYAQGNQIPSAFDSNIAKIITWGVNRRDALARMQQALFDTSCAVETGLSNKSLLLELIRESSFRDGPVQTRWLESYLPDRTPPGARPHLAVALAAAAIGDHLNARRQELRLFFAEALTGLPRRARKPGPRVLKYMVDRQLLEVEMSCLSPMTYLVGCGPWEAVVEARSAGANTMILDVDGQRYGVVRVLASDQLHLDVDGIAHRFEKVSDGKIAARVPAAINQIHVCVGDVVEAGQRLITLEAMKMEFPVDAPISGTVEAILVGPAQSIDAGQILVELAPAAGEEEDLGPAIELPRRQREQLPLHQVLRACLLGYDIDDAIQQRALNALIDAPDTLSVEQLLELWSVYISGACLFWKGPGDDAVNDAGESSAEQLAWFLRRRRLDEDALSPQFITRLSHYLGLHGVPAAASGARLDNALVRLFQTRANRAVADQIATEALHHALARTRGDEMLRRAALFRAPLAWTSDEAAQLLEASATRAAERRHWELASLTWRYMHVLESRAGALTATEPLAPAGKPPQWEGFQVHEMPVEICAAEGVALRALAIDGADDDHRLFVEARFAPVGGLVQSAGRLPEIERVFLDASAALRQQIDPTDSDDNHRRWNRIVLEVQGSLHTDSSSLLDLAERLAAQTKDLFLEAVVVEATDSLTIDGVSGSSKCAVLDTATGLGPSVRVLADNLGVAPLTDHQRGVLKAHRRGRFHPFEVVDWLTDGPGTQDHNIALVTFPPAPSGKFEEWDFVDASFQPVQRPWGQNTASLIVGIITNNRPTIGPLRRVLIVGDATRTMGSLGEEECRRAVAAIDLAVEEGIPLEWVPVSAGARIAFDSGTENLDWTARVLRRIIEFTQAGGVINIIVDGPCVGAQSYWNAEATMLMHCRGALVMTHKGYMILTGRKALEYSGSVAAETNRALGGDEIMIPNGEAHYEARHLIDAYELLFRHYEFTHPGAQFSSTDPTDRNFADSPGRRGEGYQTLMEIFSDDHNPGKKKPFAIRDVMEAVLDQDVRPLERWSDLRGADTAVTWMGSLDGQPVSMIGIESRPVPRKGPHPVDGPDTWMSGTLFPQSSRKIARAINAASGVHPLVVLANLSGFDGSPESLRERQLEFGAEIARGIVNFEGPILFTVIARYHGGAFVVFSRALNEGLRVSALEGTFASVIGGAPAAAVVFPREVDRRLREDPRFREAKELANPAESRAAVAALRAEIQGRLATEFDGVHNINRAREVGSLDDILAPHQLRPYLVNSLREALHS